MPSGLKVTHRIGSVFLRKSRTMVFFNENKKILTDSLLRMIFLKKTLFKVMN